jgi:CheY-like chemotaxis protein
MTLPTVLVADNDLAVSALLAEVLARAGLSVRMAHDGEAALAMAAEPGLVGMVCDLDMPRRSGLEVLEELAKQGVLLPAVVISGYLDAAIDERLKRLPAVREVLRKPFDLLSFAARARQHFAAGARAGDAAAAGAER